MDTNKFHNYRKSRNNHSDTCTCSHENHRHAFLTTPQTMPPCSIPDTSHELMTQTTYPIMPPTLQTRLFNAMRAHTDSTNYNNPQLFHCTSVVVKTKPNDTSHESSSTLYTITEFIIRSRFVCNNTAISTDKEPKKQHINIIKYSP